MDGFDYLGKTKIIMWVEEACAHRSSLLIATWIMGPTGRPTDLTHSYAHLGAFARIFLETDDRSSGPTRRTLH